MRKRRQSHEIDTGTFADISFLLLIFFMVVTTFHKSYQIEMALPPKSDRTSAAKIPKNRILNIYLNETKQVLVNDRVVNEEVIDLEEDLRKITAGAKKGFIKIHMLPSTAYQDYLRVLANIKRSRRSLMEKVAQENYKNDFDQLSIDQKKSISKSILYSVTEIETKI